jgi:hypothetical protein
MRRFTFPKASAFSCTLADHVMLLVFGNQHFPFVSYTGSDKNASFSNLLACPAFYTII